MGFESFYGGRQGAPFIIVKHFDGLDIPVGTEYKRKLCAVYHYDDYHNYFYYPFIEKDGDNYKDYAWDILTLDGSTIDVWDGTDVVSHELETVSAEGMRQCFEKGGDSTNIVNYGEYVIIDTYVNLKEKNNPDNGKVYRRGMNFIYDATTNPLAGAEYIGQIIGPQGESPELDMNTIQYISQQPNAHFGVDFKYTEENEGIVPGKYIDSGTGQAAYNDAIDYAWVTLMDEFGDVQSAIIGFTFPYLVQEFIARQRSAYDEHGDILPDDFECITRIDDQSHPYYSLWRIELPHGIKGDTLNSLSIYPSRPFPEANIYSDSSLTILVGQATGNEVIDMQLYDPSLSYIQLENGNYIAAADGWRTRIRCLKWNYDSKEDGESEYLDVGPYNLIRGISLTADGKLTVYFTNENNYNATLTTLIDAKVNTRDPDSGASIGDEGSGSQKVQVTYSIKDGIENKKEEIGEPLNYILDTYVVPESDTQGYKGCLLVYYSDPERREASEIKDLSYPSKRLGKNVTGWTNLGDIHGITQTPLSFAEYASFSDIPNAAPEIIMGTPSNPNYRYAGWGCIYTNNGVKYIAEYDYLNSIWTAGIPYGDGITDPSVVINYLPAGAIDGIAEHGFRIDTTNRVVAEEPLPDGIISGLSRKTSDPEHAGSYVYTPRAIGSEVRYVGGQRNSNIHNLEEQLILGTDIDRVTEISKAEGDSYITKTELTKYKTDNSENDYYIIQKEVKTKLSALFNDGILSLDFEPSIVEKTERLAYGALANVPSPTINISSYVTKVSAFISGPVVQISGPIIKTQFKQQDVITY